MNDQGEVYRDKWSPQIVIVLLGVNDFSTPLNQNEKWKTRVALQDEFVSAYEKFVLSIRKKYPKAHIFLISPDSPASEVTRQITRVVEALKMQGENKVIFKTPDVSLELTSCQYHPSAKDHSVVAKQMIDFIEKDPSVWDK